MGTYQITQETKDKMRLAKLGKKRFPHTTETKAKMRNSALKNGNSVQHTVPHSEEARRKISESKKGCIPWNYIQDRTKLAEKQERNDTAYKEWRQSVWVRDKYRCRIANQDCEGKIEAHHILSWSEYVELRYKTNNGITLCHAHHPRKRAEEKRLIPTFTELVSVSK